MNENNKSQSVKTETDLITGLCRPNIPISPTGAIYRETTANIARFVVDMLANSFKIHEADHVFMYPIKDKSNRIVDFNLLIYFDTRRGGNNPNISRVNGNKKQTSDNRPDLMAIAGTRFSNGGFQLSEHFKKVITPIAITQDGNIVVKADPNHSFVGVIECDFFKVIELCLGITSTDNYDFSIIGCDQVRGTNEGLDYFLTFTKEISDNVNRKGRGGIDYSVSDMRTIKNAGNGRR